MFILKGIPSAVKDPSSTKGMMFPGSWLPCGRCLAIQSGPEATENTGVSGPGVLDALREEVPREPSE